jgi:predicted nucleic acid-binding OB-fold protein
MASEKTMLCWLSRSSSITVDKKELEFGDMFDASKVFPATLKALQAKGDVGEKVVTEKEIEALTAEKVQEQVDKAVKAKEEELTTSIDEKVEAGVKEALVAKDEFHVKHVEAISTQITTGLEAVEGLTKAQLKAVTKLVAEAKKAEFTLDAE